jgi:hypothetical protein
MNIRLRRSKATQKRPNPAALMPPVTIRSINHGVTSDTTILSYSHASGRMQALEGKNKFQAVDENVSVVSIGATPVDVFLRSFREHGSEFISSAYL